MDKYQQYLKILKGAFSNAYESAGGNEFRYFHCLNVANISNLLSRAMGLVEKEIDIVIIASIFHDIAKSKRVQVNGFLDGSRDYEIQSKSMPHELESAEMANDILKDYLPSESIEKIKETITNHNTPSTVLEKILHDADELSEMGAMNLWKMFTYSSYKKRDLHATIKYWKEEDKKRHRIKIATLFLEESKKEGEKRIEIVDKIINNLETQISNL